MQQPTAERGSAANRSDNSVLERAKAAAKVAEENRGRDIVILDVRELTELFDYFVIASGTSRPQLQTMSDEIERLMEEQFGQRRLGREGYEEGRWILLDFGDIVIHLFDPDTRQYYALEDLWAPAKRIVP